MAPFPEEVDVFTAPHWRMKQLVGLYCDKVGKGLRGVVGTAATAVTHPRVSASAAGMELSKTNFSNNNDFRALLQSLYATFKEFKMHEQIENEYIIGLLQQRSQTVYNVHSDNKLSEMLSLFEKGLKNVKVFQPMLMEYFTYEELKDIKKKVIAQHCSQKETGAEIRRGISLLNQAEELQKAFKYSVDEKAEHEIEEPEQATNIVHLPSEVMLTIFSYLSPQELCRCSQVSTKWSQIAKTGFLWKHLYPVHWARGNWSHGPPGDPDTEPDEEWVKNRKDESQAFHEWDEDADIDESEENGEESSAISIVQKEKDLLQGIIHNILPRVGSSVKTIVLAYSSAISNKMVRYILELCPNLEYLDLTQTDISDSAFESWSWIGCCQSLRHLDLSGCERITDMAVRKISKALGILSSHEVQSQKSFQNRRGKTVWKNKEIALELSKKDCGLHYITNENVIKEEGNESHWNVPVRSKGFNSAYIWMLDAKDLADIEDAAEWKHRNLEGDCVIEPASPFPCSASCYNKDIFGLRTSFCWQEQEPCASAALTYCGHSFCCAGSALKTLQALQPSPGLLYHAPRTNRQIEGKDLAHLRSAKSDQKTARVLQFLSLSGCYQITDIGLRMLALRGGLPYLEHLNLSGCLTVTSAGLQDLVSVCPSLNHEHFYYCDNINGPHAETASGCQNLQCGFRACCRSGE
ncbi:F-box/LRR-repeat protein 5 isoform X3 [Ahaetulla prasina]|uniref:F-box/LRR-repeat protein 5 isoform X3 n=1 Tax=Ahaetulla prasina TaxID=499056 RepID=UPI0026471CAD|nr:F-box/LRR-repeat protein 5 isoform X3 [Ahaetulla prasina]